MSQKASPRRTGKMKAQVVQWPSTTVIKQPTMKRRKGRGTKIGKELVVLHTPLKW